MPGPEVVLWERCSLVGSFGGVAAGLFAGLPAPTGLSQGQALWGPCGSGFTREEASSYPTNSAPAPLQCFTGKLLEQLPITL